MGRFYQTAKPTFVDDAMYKSPWELIQTALATEQNNYDGVQGELDLFNDVKFKYISQSPEEAKLAQEKQAYYMQEANKLTDKLQNDPNYDWRKAKREALNLGRQLKDDMTTGDIAKMETSYSYLEQFEKDNEELRKKNPEAYRRFIQSQLGGWEGSKKGVFNPTNYVEGPRKEIEQAIKDMPTLERTFKENGYYLDYKGKPREEMLRAISSRLAAYSQLPEYYNQQGNILGESGYFDKDGYIPPFTEIDTTTGKVMTPEDKASAIKAGKEYATKNKIKEELSEDDYFNLGNSALGNKYQIDINPNSGEAAWINSMVDTYSHWDLKNMQETESTKRNAEYRNAIKVEQEKDRLANASPNLMYNTWGFTTEQQKEGFNTLETYAKRFLHEGVQESKVKVKNMKGEEIEVFAINGVPLTYDAVLEGSGGKKVKAYITGNESEFLRDQIKTRAMINAVYLYTNSDKVQLNENPEVKDFWTTESNYLIQSYNNLLNSEQMASWEPVTRQYGEKAADKIKKEVNKSSDLLATQKAIEIKYKVLDKKGNEAWVVAKDDNGVPAPSLAAIIANPAKYKINIGNTTATTTNFDDALQGRGDSTNKQSAYHYVENSAAPIMEGDEWGDNKINSVFQVGDKVFHVRTSFNSVGIIQPSE
jgi:hypothetical protein